MEKKEVASTYAITMSLTFFTATSDYNQLINFQLVFQANSQPSSTQSFSVVITNDAIPEGEESFRLSTSDNNPRASSTRDTATGIIQDDDGEINN